MNNQVLNRMRQRQADIQKSLDDIIKADRETLRLLQGANRK